jgi:hypothetical protein
MLRIHTIGAIALLAALVLGSTAWPEATEEYRKSVTLPPGAGVNVENTNGTIRISVSDSQNADIVATKKTRRDRDELDRVRIEIITDGGLTVRAVYEQRGRLFGTGPQVSVDFDIRLPRNAAVRSVKTTNGNIEIDDAGGEPTLQTTNGAVRASGVPRIASARSTNGSIRIEDASQVREAKTTNGSINVSLLAGGEINAETVNGSVSLSLPKGTNADLELRTVNGRIRIPDGITLKAGEIRKTRISGRLGNGGPLVEARTVNGSITLETE